MAFYKQFKAFFLSISVVAFVFLIWDELFTQIGVWGFNPKYLTGIYIGHLPLEEVLFFFCIPFASLFIHYSLAYFKPKWLIADRNVTRISIFLFLLVLVAVLYNIPAKYTSVNGVFFLILVLWTFFKPNNELNRFYLSFLIILIPFFLVNGILTGSFIDEPVVWYNNSENLGLRIGTIPVEDVFYAFNMLYPTLMFTKFFAVKFNL